MTDVHDCVVVAAPRQVTLNIFPSTTDPPWFGAVRYAPWVTGSLITIAMFFIYSAAPNMYVVATVCCVIVGGMRAPADASCSARFGRDPRVRRSEYEIFWWNHHMFVLFYVAQIFHGPRFIYWTCFPIFLYVLERVLRVTRGRRTVYVKAVRWIDPVMCIELMPKDRNQFKFIEGQYIYLNCPYLSPNEVRRFCASACRTVVSLTGPCTARRGSTVAPVHHFLSVWRPHVRRPRPHGAHPRVPQGLDGAPEGVLWPHEPSEPVRCVALVSDHLGSGCCVAV